MLLADIHVQDATLAVLGMMLKCADVMHMTQPFHKHKQWVELLTEEFFQQGDREIALGMQPMPFMNRSKPQCVPSSQVRLSRHPVVKHNSWM